MVLELQFNIAVTGTSLVVQGRRICLPMKGTPVLFRVRELKSHMPMCCNYRACVRQIQSTRAATET